MFDGLGSERTVTNSSQTVTGTITFEGFGATIATTGSSSNPYKFAATSRYRDDGDAGLSHVGARYYDAQVGRFITRDTELDQHPYLYCEHDPVNALDPSGHFWFLFVLALVIDLTVRTGDPHGDPPAISPWVIPEAAFIGGFRAKLALHGAHHTFGKLGKLPHVQLNVWIKGGKGSGQAIRLPLPR